MSSFRTGKTIEQLFAVRLSVDLLQRLRLEAVRSEQTIRSIVAAALDDHLPKQIEVVVGKRGSRRNRRDDRRAAEA